MTAPTDLLPCPFCGWGARMEARVSEKPPPECHVACFGDCEVSPSVWRASEAEAIAAWNRRASPQPANPAQGVSEEDVEAILRRHIKVDATGMAPAVASAYVIGFEEAAREITAAIGAGGQAVACKECDGTGFKDKNGARLTLARTPCGACGGSGNVAALSQPHPADERVVEALREIAGDVPGNWEEKFHMVQQIARAALAQEGR